MKKALRYIASLLLFYLLLFAASRAVFMLYNRSSDAFTATDMWEAWWHGLPMDASTAGYLMALPWLACFVAMWYPRFAMRRVLRPYFIITGVLLAMIIALDIVLYASWQFKLDSSLYSYMGLHNGAASSVSTGFMVVGILLLVLFSALIAYAAIMLTPRIVGTVRSGIKGSLVLTLVGGLLFVMIRGGVQEGTMNVGSVYYSQRLFLNHSAVNPVFSLMYSTTKMKHFDEQFRYFSPEEASAHFEGLYPQSTEALSDTLLRVQRPQVILIQLESFGAQFIAELGGRPNVCPNLSRYMPEAVLFDRCYANSFRTDRGTVSLQSGHVSYPTVSLMKYPARLPALPSIAHSLTDVGYVSDYYYGGDISIMGKQGYLISAGFSTLTSSKDFTMAQVNESKWGANDSVVFDRAFTNIMKRPASQHWMSTVQTLNSHEPFEVPYHRLEDKVLNSFAYTDYCVGQFLDRLKATSLWDNLLVVMFADHGIMYGQTYETPEFFHIPVIMVGGALKGPRRIHTIMNQSDVAATLLAQMGVSHRQYAWSRNVLSPEYTYPFAYSTYPSGIMLADSTGVSIYDVNADRTIVNKPLEHASLNTPEASRRRVTRAKAILQKSYDMLGH